MAKDRKTIRMLESLIRLAEAPARLMFKRDIEIYDAICVIVLMEQCVNTGLFERHYCCLMSSEMYTAAKRECLYKLGLDPTYFEDDDYDQGGGSQFEEEPGPVRPHNTQKDKNK